MTAPARDFMASALCARIGPTFDQLPLAAQFATCETCPVRQECLDYGDSTGSTGVVYGGQLRTYTGALAGLAAVRRSRKLDAADVAEIVNRRAAGETVSSLAEQYSVSAQAISYRLESCR